MVRLAKSPAIDRDLPDSTSPAEPVYPQHSTRAHEGHDSKQIPYRRGAKQLFRQFQRLMRILYDHQVFSLQDAGGASRYHFELVRNLQGSDGVELEMLMGLTGSVMPFAALGQTYTKVLAHGTRIKPGVARYAINELFSALVG